MAHVVKFEKRHAIKLATSRCLVCEKSFRIGAAVETGDFILIYCARCVRSLHKVLNENA